MVLVKSIEEMGQDKNQVIARSANHCTADESEFHTQKGTGFQYTKKMCFLLSLPGTQMDNHPVEAIIQHIMSYLLQEGVELG